MTESPSPSENGTPSSPGAKSSTIARAERWIALGATCSCLGILLSLTSLGPLGGIMVCLGTAGCVIGLHRYGRSGPDPLPSVVASQDSDGDVVA